MYIGESGEKGRGLVRFDLCFLTTPGLSSRPVARGGGGSGGSSDPSQNDQIQRDRKIIHA